ncbi:sigma 54-interacting transcriptional regulator [Vulgatibacter sp.]|uniref:sigma 54-interacting transcriptional regulator n=1 Tax=Vulgatibacter sp. TaxID=1971226 RepID=UPI00356AFAA0
MEIRALRGERSRAEFAALVGVTPLTVYRWELPPGSPELRRPRGKVLARLRSLVAAELPAQPPRPPDATLDPADEAALLPALRAIDECHLDGAETELVALLSGGALRGDASRALASIALARLHLLARHDARSAFATLLGVGDVARLPRPVQLRFHVVSAHLHAHADLRLFSLGRTNHHAALAEALFGAGDEDERFFLWYAQLTAAISVYEPAMVARLVERSAEMRALATTPLNRCLALEAACLCELSYARAGEASRSVEAFRAASVAAGLPLQQLRALAWGGEVAIEEAEPPPRILEALEQAERIQQRHRIADGVHSMHLHRNEGEVLMRLGRLGEAEAELLEATRIGSSVGFTPFRIYTSLARLYAQRGRIEGTRRIADELLRFEGVHMEHSRAFGRIARILCDVLEGKAEPGWPEAVVENLAAIRRAGAWAIAYRYVAVHAAAICTSAAPLQEAERILQLAERAFESSASLTASALFRRYRGIFLLRTGRHGEARQSLEAALATFQVSGNLPEAALVRRALANLDHLEGRPEAEGHLAESAAALEALGMAVPPLLASEAPPPAAAQTASRLHVDDLVVPLQRLTTRGLGASILQRELVDIATGLLPGRSVALVEVDSEGGILPLGGEVGGPADPRRWFDFSDGVGRRLRLGVGGALAPEERAALSSLVSTAALAFEVAALRGFSRERPRQVASRAPAEEHVLPGFIAASEPMRRLKAELERLSGSRSTIIITGESGTGKEVVARAIHDLSQRAARPYVTFNSAAIPRELFEGQLFGYRKGAFTGATSDNPGVIRAAEGGTLFLDEIGELPLETQPKLLRFLENGEIFPLGERNPARVDVRVIAATHRELLELVREGRFREDLYYRLQVIPVHIPPLRERRADVVALARFFLRKLTPEGRETPVLSPDAELALVAHGWPGNVRQLRNVIERSLAFDPLPPILTAEHLRL